MLHFPLTHPQILQAIGAAGHGSQILIADGNYPAATARGPNATLVHLNLSPGVLSATEVLRALAAAIPIEAAHVMAVLESGPYALPNPPPIWDEFRAVLEPVGVPPLEFIERHGFYEAARSGDVCLTIQTGDQRLYANLLLTIGVRSPG